jgi:hypothetical protein
MFEEAFENLHKVTDAAIRTQQQIFKKCVKLWPVVPFPVGLGVARKYRKESVQIIGELLKKQRESAEAQFSENLRTVEEIFHLGEVEDPEEFRTKVVDIWQKRYDSLRQTYEAQVNEFLTAVAKGAELLTKPPAPHVAA